MTERLKLGEILVNAAVITSEQLARALDEQAASGGKARLGAVITKLGLATESEIASAIAQQLGVPYLDLHAITPEPGVVDLIPRRMAEHHQVVAVDRTSEGTVTIAMADPTNVVAVDDVRVRVGAELRVAVATATAIHDSIERGYGLAGGAAVSALELGGSPTVEVVPDIQVEDDLESVKRSTEMAPIVRLVNAILSDATHSGATDVHIEPGRKDVRVRFRIDGQLREVMTVPKYAHLSIVSRIKVMNGMDIAERRRPQDGRGRVLVDGEEIDIRVSTIHTLHGEKVVMRLLRKGEGTIEFGALGMGAADLQLMERLLSMPQGLIIFTGPTGSGKTTSMYAALRHLIDPSKNIVTLEDPIEYQIAGVNQVQIDERTGITFARGLRMMLRQDPNVILVGEIRDTETAQIAMQAALTGHLVMTTLHTNDAPSAVTRLLDIGVEPFLIGSALSAVVAQRLVRTVCTQCTERSDPSERTLAMLGMTRGDLAPHTILQGAGCTACAYTGYRGRTGLFEILSMTRQVREQIVSGVSDGEIARIAREDGLRTLRHAGLALAFDGVTTLDEVLRATYFERDDSYRCPGCRQEVERGFSGCPFCGTVLAGRQCPSCARPARPDWRACPWCSTQLGEHAPLATGLPRVMIVDDDAELCGMLAAAFESDFALTAVPDAAEAYRRATLERPDLILLDLMLPDEPGTQLAGRLRAQVATSDIPILMLTGADDHEAEVTALETGVDDFVRKPLEADVLRARIGALLRRALRR